MIDRRETDGNNEICLGVHFCLVLTIGLYWALFLGRWSSTFFFIQWLIQNNKKQEQQEKKQG